MEFVDGIKVTDKAKLLENEIDPPDWVIWATFILMALGTVGLALYHGRSFSGYRGRRFRR